MAAPEILAASDRFWARVDKSGECWIFQGAKDKDGYGQFMVNYVNYRAHRYALMLAGRPVAHGLVTRHLCDVRACVRPDHLIEGTQAENIADAIHSGHLNPRRISPEVESAIRREYRPREVTFAQLASQHGISKSQAHRIVKEAA